MEMSQPKHNAWLMVEPSIDGAFCGAVVVYCCKHIWQSILDRRKSFVIDEPTNIVDSLNKIRFYIVWL